MIPWLGLLYLGVAIVVAGTLRKRLSAGLAIVMGLGWLPLLTVVALVYLAIGVVAIMAHGAERDRGEGPRMDRWGLR